MKQAHNPEQWLWPHMYSRGNNTELGGELYTTAQFTHMDGYMTNPTLNLKVRVCAHSVWTVCQLLKDVVCYQKLAANVHVVCFQCTYHRLYAIYKVSELQVGMTCALSLEVLLRLRWHNSLSAKVNKNANLGYSYDHG